MSNTITTFDSSKEALPQMLIDIGSGKTQLPDFQRGWVWNDEHIRSLLASISLRYPIGAVMLLEAGGTEVRFKPRLVEGVVLPDPHPRPNKLIMDGQQRLTSLFQAFNADMPVSTKDSRDKSIRRWYYFHIDKCLSSSVDREDAIIGLPEDRVLRNFRRQPILDCSTRERECEEGLFPVYLTFGGIQCHQWMMKYCQVPGETEERLAKWGRFSEKILQCFQQYQMPMIVLREEAPKEAVCQVFEKVNTGGVALTVFELLTATFAADDFNLRVDWEKRQKAFEDHPAKRLLRSVESTDFLQAITLLATYRRRQTHERNGGSTSNAPGISCKRKDMLRLQLDEYQSAADALTEGFKDAAKLMHDQGLYSSKDLPYRTQLTPLAAALTLLGRRGGTAAVRDQLARWYWCGVLGELYGGSVDTRLARDLPELLAWIEGGQEPTTITESGFRPERLLTLRTRSSAAYKGIHVLLLKQGCQDFLSGEAATLQSYFDDSIDIHHVFPRDWCRRNGIADDLCESVVNRTPLSARTNRMIGGKAPSEYLRRFIPHSDTSRMREILGTHAIDPDDVHNDDFQSFFENRKRALLDLIQKATGKKLLEGGSDS